ncbi:hypothetical protein Tco_0721775 [Tanacetum coccineum]
MRKHYSILINQRSYSPGLRIGSLAVRVIEVVPASILSQRIRSNLKLLSLITRLTGQSCLSVPLKGVNHTPLVDTRSGRPQVYILTLSSTTRTLIKRVESGSKKFLKPDTKLPNSASYSSVYSYPAPQQSASQVALRRFVEVHNEQMKDMHSQLADKNIELRLPTPFVPNDFMDDASDESDEGDEGDAHEDVADPGDE